MLSTLDLTFSSLRMSASMLCHPQGMAAASNVFYPRRRVGLRPGRMAGKRSRLGGGVGVNADVQVDIDDKLLNCMHWPRCLPSSTFSS